MSPQPSLSARRPWLAFLALALFVALSLRVWAQEAPPASLPQPAIPAPTATPLPKPTATPLPTPVPIPLQDIGAQPIRTFTDPNRVVSNPIAVAPTPTPAPTATPKPTPVAIPPSVLPDDITGQEPSDGQYSLEAPSGVLYDGDRGLALARGNIAFRYRDFLVRGNQAVVDYNTNTATVSGNLTVLARYNGQSQSFTGQTLTFDLDSSSWRLSQLATTFPPDYFPEGTVLEPIYVTDGRVVGKGDNAYGENFKFSSCDRGHYYLKSNRIEFTRTTTGQPKRLVLRKNALYVFGHKVLPLPVYVVSLLSQNPRNQPIQSTFGQDTLDGYFVKSAYNLHATDKLTDSVLLDLLQRRGIGAGFNREWVSGGLLSLYVLSGQTGGREVTSQLQKSYKLGDGNLGSINFQSTQNNSLTGEGISSQTGNFSLARQTNQVQSSLVYTLNSSTFGTSSNRTDTLQFDHHQDFGSGLSLTTSGTLNQVNYGGLAIGSFGSKTQTGDLNIQLGRTSKRFDLYLRSELHNDFTQGTTTQVERLPELLFQSATNRIDFPLLNKIIPGDFTFGYGRFNEPSPTSTDISGRQSRTDFFYNAHERSVRLLGNAVNNSIFRATGSFEQAFYSDDTARYNYSYNFNLTNKAGPAQLAFNYAKQRTYGFTPFQFDFTTPGEYFDYTASVQTGEKFRLNISGGRDIQNGFNRDVIGSLQYSPAQSLYLSLGTNYIMPNKDASGRDGFGDIYGNLRLNRGTRGFLPGNFALGVRYSPDGRGLTRANASIDTKLTSKARIQALVGYDGIAKRYDFSQYRITYDLHCFNLYGTYDGSRNQFRIDLALKAFPFADTRYGRDDQSQSFDANVGTIQ